MLRECWFLPLRAHTLDEWLRRGGVPPDAHARAPRFGCASTPAGLLACAAGSFLAALLAAHLDDDEHPWIGCLALYVLALGMTVLFAIGAKAGAMRPAVLTCSPGRQRS